MQRLGRRLPVTANAGRFRAEASRRQAEPAYDEQPSQDWQAVAHLYQPQWVRPVPGCAAWQGDPSPRRAYRASAWAEARAGIRPVAGRDRRECCGAGGADWGEAEAEEVEGRVTNPEFHSAAPRIAN